MSKSELMNINGNSITAHDVMDAVDTVLEVLWQSGNLDNAIKASNSLGMIEEISGKAKAKLWHGWQRWWSETGQDEKRNDTFEDMMEAETGNKAVTVKRYVNVWKYVDECIIPKDVQERPMRDLIPIATALSQGYEFEKDDWKKLARASNSSEVLEIVRTKKGSEPRKSGIQITLDRQGSLWAWKENKKYYVGVLEVNDTNEVVKKAIQRITDSSGIQEK
jgi:hypothetical protein